MTYIEPVKLTRVWERVQSGVPCLESWGREDNSAEQQWSRNRGDTVSSTLSHLLNTLESHSICNALTPAMCDSLILLGNWGGELKLGNKFKCIFWDMIKVAGIRIEAWHKILKISATCLLIEMHILPRETILDRGETHPETWWCLRIRVSIKKEFSQKRTPKVEKVYLPKMETFVSDSEGYLEMIEIWLQDEAPANRRRFMGEYLESTFLRRIIGVGYDIDDQSAFQKPRFESMWLNLMGSSKGRFFYKIIYR